MERGETRRLVVAYDITEDTRRSRVALALEDHGIRAQYSVFECQLTASERNRLSRRLVKLIDPATDTVSLYPLCGRCHTAIERLGRHRADPDPRWIIL